MASTTFNKRINLNEFRKVYPFVRVEPKYRFVADKEILLEEGEITITSTDNGVYTFTEKYNSVPNVQATPYDSAGNEEANVNLFIRTLSTTSVRIEASAEFTGKILVQVLKIN